MRSMVVVMKKSEQLVLASGSSMRAKILTQAGYDFVVVKPDDQAEPDPVQNEPAADYVLRAAREKGFNVASRRPEALIVAADQVVEFEGGILRKTAGYTQALERLQNLSGRTHFLVGAWLLIRQGAVIAQGVNRVAVTLHQLQRDEVSAYLKREKPYSSVACYFLEGEGIRLVDKLEGCYFSALGLALPDIQRVLRRL